MTQRHWHNEMGPLAPPPRPSAQDRNFQVLSAVLRFFSAPLETSLWWVALIGYGLAFATVVYAIASVLMLMDIGGVILSSCVLIAFAVSGFYLWGMRNLK